MRFAKYYKEHSDLSNTDIARLIHKDNPKMSVRRAREIIAEERPPRPDPLKSSNINLIDNLDLPDGIDESYPDYTITTRNNLIFYDIHIPYHSLETLRAGINYGKEHKITGIFLGGDIVDFYALSRFNKDPRRSFKEELDTTKKFLTQLRELFPSAEIYFKLGNHEDRLEKFLFSKTPELVGLDQLEIENLLDFGKLRIRKIQSQQVAKMGHLNVIHGHEYLSGFSAVNIARNVLLKAFDNVMQGHSHITSYYPATKINHDIVAGWSVGCGCKLRPTYRCLNNWNNGFAHVTVEDNKDFEVYNKTVVNGKIY